MLARLAELGAVILPPTTAFGTDGRPDLLWRVQAARVVLAAGAIERPLPFALNDLPGIMSAQAGLSYPRRHAVLAGERVLLDHPGLS